MAFHVPEKHRIKTGKLKTTKDDGNNGAFSIAFSDYPLSLKKRLKDQNVLPCVLFIIASEGLGWDHLSVTINRPRCPTWEELCHIKSLFWDEEDVVIQIHPKKSEYINNHEYCLHLWKKSGSNDYVELPPSILVGLPT